MKRLFKYLANPKTLFVDFNKSKEELLEVNLDTSNRCKVNDFPYFTEINCSNVHCTECPFNNKSTVITFISSINIHRASNGKLYEYRISKSGKKYRKYF